MFILARRSVSSALGRGEVQFEDMSITVMRKNNWTTAMLVDWLLGGHIHIIACHPHMNMDKINPSIEDFYHEFGRLKYHPGFPTLNDLSCPIWRQDKYKYLCALPSRYVLPTIKIPLSEDMDMEKTKVLIDRLLYYVYLSCFIGCL